MTGAPVPKSPKIPREIAALLLRRVLRPGARLRRVAAPLTALKPGARRLVLAPKDLRTADPTVAVDIYSGLFAFAGRTVDTGGKSPFGLRPPSEAWARELHGFSWLRHLRASENELTRSNGRALVDEWLRARPHHPPVAWEPTVAARRLAAWLSQSPLLLKDCDRDFYVRFMRAIDRHVARLAAAFDRAPDGVPRLLIAIVLVAAGAAIADQPRLLRAVLRRLERELDRQVLPDGGHVSRNPTALVNILAELLPVRHALSVRGVAPPARLGEAVDRMMPMLSFFRHPDGKFAHFNGAGTAPRGLFAAILAHDDVRGQPSAYARYSGYQRIDAGGAVLIIDVGAPPPLAFAATAHAGCLSLEFSHGEAQIIVNCGALHEAEPDWREAGRTTAAHSTVTLEDTSSARILARPALVARLGPLLYRGPRHVDVRRGEEADRTVVAAAHDGYRDDFGVVHERIVSLSHDGATLSGRDHLAAAAVAGVAFAARFHLHPDVSVSPSATASAAMLTLADGTLWRFAVDSGQRLAVEESVHLSERHRLRRTSQIVIRDNTANADAVRWTLEKQVVVAAPADTLAASEAGTPGAPGAAAGGPDTVPERPARRIRRLADIARRAREDGADEADGDLGD